MASVVPAPGTSASGQADHRADQNVRAQQAIMQSPLVGERGTFVDANFDAGYGSSLGDNHRGSFLVRGRLGVMLVRAPWFYMIGPTIEWSQISDKKVTMGLQGEIMHLESGAWIQAGGLLDTGARPGFMASVGLSILGAEFQVRDGGDRTITAVFGKLRIPLGYILFAMSSK
jgi:hypothetical protein